MAQNGKDRGHATMAPGGKGGRHVAAADRPTFRERVLLAAAAYALFFGCYSLVNHHIPIPSCMDLTTSLDRATPFLPPFVFPFYLTYLLIGFPAFLIRKRDLLIRSGLGFAVLIVFSCLLFTILPVQVPRPGFIPDSLSGRLVGWIYRHDRPVCGFPSLHVSAAVLAAFVVLRERRCGVVFLLLAVLTSLSTLFIKQHGIVDVLGGVAAACLVDRLIVRHAPASLPAPIRAGILLIRNTSERQPGGRRGRFREHSGRTLYGTSFDVYDPISPAGKTVLLVHGLTPRGERDTRLVRFARCLAESGLRAVAVRLPGLMTCRFDRKDLSALVDLVSFLHQDRIEKIGIIGFSIGAGLALKASADPGISRSIDPVILFGPHFSLPELWNHMRKKIEEIPCSDEERDARIWVRLVMLYRAMDEVGMGKKEKEDLTDFLGCYCHGPTLEQKVRFCEGIFQGKEDEVMKRQNQAEEDLVALSPAGGLSFVSARVMIFHDPFDALVPVDHSKRLYQELVARQADRGHRLLVTPLVSHVTARYGLRLYDAFRIVRILGEIFR